MANKRKTEIQILSERLTSLADKADKAALLLNVKSQFAKQCYDNGASIESVADKLDWKPQKLRDLLKPETDIDMRSLSDMFFALGRQLHVKCSEK